MTKSFKVSEGNALIFRIDSTDVDINAATFGCLNGGMANIADLCMSA